MYSERKERGEMEEDPAVTLTQNKLMDSRITPPI